MKRKYFFFDYDGTLAIPRTRAIPDGTRACIDELRARGHFVALATGRLQCNALDYIDSLGIDNIVADGGYSVTLGGELKWMRPLDLEPARECLRRLDKDGVPWAVQTANEMCRWSPLENYEEISGEYYLPCKHDPTILPIRLMPSIKSTCPANRATSRNISPADILRVLPGRFMTPTTSSLSHWTRLAASR